MTETRTQQTYRALSVWQPHATMLATGMRRIETRSWPCSYRGRVLIHAAKRWDEYVAEECSLAGEQIRGNPPGNLTPEAEALGNLPWKDTLGCVLAVATIAECKAIPERCGTEYDRAWGGFGPNRYGFVLTRLQTLREPIPARGAQGLWIPPSELIGDVESQFVGVEGRPQQGGPS